MRIANFDFCMALSIQSKKRNTINVKLERSENTSSVNLYVVVLWPQTKCCSRDNRPRSRFVDISGNSYKTQFTHDILTNLQDFMDFIYTQHSHPQPQIYYVALSSFLVDLTPLCDAMTSIKQREKKLLPLSWCLFTIKVHLPLFKSVRLCLFFGVRTLCKSSKKRRKSF